MVAPCRRSPRLPLGAAVLACVGGLATAQSGAPRTPTDGAVAYDAVQRRIAAWVAGHQRLVQRHSIGESVEGRDLTVLRISAADSDDVPSLYLGAGIHGNEGSEQDLVWMIDRLLARADEPWFRAMLTTRVLWVQPLMNPDGVLHHRRTNARDVDLNRNFGHLWKPRPASTGPSQSINPGDPGPTAFSEPETRAVRDFLLAQANLRAYLDLHCSARLIIVPEVGSGGAPAAACQRAFADLDAAMGGYDQRTGPMRSSMPLSQQGGFSIDWVWGRLGVIAFSWELRRGAVDAGDADPRWRGRLHLLRACATYERSPPRRRYLRRPARPGRGAVAPLLWVGR